MPAGVHAPHPAELLGSKRCQDFIASLGEHFDWIIVIIADGKTVQEVLEACPEIELVRPSSPVTGQGVWAPCGW